MQKEAVLPLAGVVGKAAEDPFEEDIGKSGNMYNPWGGAVGLQRGLQLESCFQNLFELFIHNCDLL